MAGRHHADDRYGSCGRCGHLWSWHHRVWLRELQPVGVRCTGAHLAGLTPVACRCTEPYVESATEKLLREALADTPPLMIRRWLAGE